MMFRDFSFPQVQKQLGLQVVDGDLFGSAEPFTPCTEFAQSLRNGTTLTLANGTDKGELILGR